MLLNASGEEVKPPISLNFEETEVIRRAFGITDKRPPHRNQYTTGFMTPKDPRWTLLKEMDEKGLVVTTVDMSRAVLEKKVRKGSGVTVRKAQLTAQVTIFGKESFLFTVRDTMAQLERDKKEADRAEA